MNIRLEPGKYLIAVSGGVDSVVLLHALCEIKDVELVIAHYDHGIRDDSQEDRLFVAELSMKRYLPFHYAEGNLGKGTSEARARKARYEFLHEVRLKSGAQSVVTAHHQDDVIETAFINLLRGTGRKGLSSLGSGPHINRPMLGITKDQIKKYAQNNNLDWREDSTNQDNDYLRNYLRNMVLPKLTREQREHLIDILDATRETNKEIDAQLVNLLGGQNSSHISRSWFIALPYAVTREVLSHWLRAQGMTFDKTAIERLAVGLKTLPPGAKTDIASGWYFIVGKEDIRIQRR